MESEMLALLFFWGAMVLLTAWQAHLFAVPRAALVAEPVRTLREVHSVRREWIC